MPYKKCSYTAASPYDEIKYTSSIQVHAQKEGHAITGHNKRPSCR